MKIGDKVKRKEHAGGFLGEGTIVGQYYCTCVPTHHGGSWDVRVEGISDIFEHNHGDNLVLLEPKKTKNMAGNYYSDDTWNSYYSSFSNLAYGTNFCPRDKRLESYTVGMRIKNVGSYSTNKCDPNTNSGKTGIITDIGDEWVNVKYDDGAFGSSNEPWKYYKIINKKTLMNKVSNMMKKLLDADTQKHIKAGFINGDLDITQAGKDALIELYYSEKKAELTKVADEVIAEAEKQENK